MIDGDSIVVASENIRLHGIDCPERKQPGGAAATTRLTDLLKDKTFQIDRTDVDRYGRTIAKVSTEIGRVSVALVRSGHCWWYQKYEKNDAELRDAEAGARSRGVGVHANPNAVPPWKWRKN